MSVDAFDRRVRSGSTVARLSMVDKAGTPMEVLVEESSEHFTRQVKWKLKFGPKDKRSIVMRHSTLGGRRKLAINGEQV